jgi:hypothetical protein
MIVTTLLWYCGDWLWTRLLRFGLPFHFFMDQLRFGFLVESLDFLLLLLSADLKIIVFLLRRVDLLQLVFLPSSFKVFALFIIVSFIGLFE